jgi:hypothetical protein
MKTLLLSFVLLLAAASFGQSKDFKRWKVGTMSSFDKQLNEIHLSPEELNGLFPEGFNPNKSIYIPDNATEKIDPIEINFTTGIIGQFSLTEKLEIGMGLAFSKKTFRKYYHLIYHNWNGTIVTQYNYYIDESNSYFDIPAFLRYNFLKSNFNFHLETGLNTSYYLDQRPTHVASKWSMLGSIGLGASYKLGNGIQFSTTAFYKKKFIDFDRSQEIFHSNSLSFELRTAFIF